MIKLSTEISIFLVLLFTVGVLALSCPGLLPRSTPDALYVETEILPIGDTLSPDHSQSFLLHTSDGGSGTCFPISTSFDPDTLIWSATFMTAKHCLTGIGENPMIIVTWGESNLAVVGFGPAVMELHPMLDVAVFTIATSEELEPREFLTDEIGFGTVIYCTGYPNGTGPFLMKGHTSGDDRISLGLAPGVSGSPVCLTDGRVVGVASQVIIGQGACGGGDFYTFAGRMEPVSGFKRWLERVR